ncbi:MAG: hypothetical protein ACTS6G_02840 [Candidatus Hodgkinia cicadicola]
MNFELNKARERNLIALVKQLNYYEERSSMLLEMYIMILKSGGTSAEGNNKLM